MELEKYNALLCSIEKGSISAAADALGYTPSAVSRNIQSLEEHLGFPLLIRGKSGIKPTEACITILPAVRNLMNAQAQLQQTADRICGIETGVVTVGTAYPFYNIQLAQRIADFKNMYPGIEVCLIDDTSSELCKKLRLHEIDFCVVTERSEIPRFHLIIEDEICAWVHKEHPAVREGVFEISRFNTENYIDIYPEKETDNSILLWKRNVKPHVAAKTSDLYAAYSMVAAGLGVALVNRSLTNSWRSDVEVLPLDVPTDVRIGIAAQAEENLSPAAKELLAYVLEHTGK